MSQQLRLPDELEITGRTASYTYRTPGKYLLKIPAGVEVRAKLQGAQGGGGGAGFSSAGQQGEGGGRIVPGNPGGLGEYKETQWMKGGDIIPIEIGEGGTGGRGVMGLHGGKGVDGWVRVEIRRMGVQARLRYASIGLWNRGTLWVTWQKAGVIASIVAATAAVIAVAITIYS